MLRGLITAIRMLSVVRIPGRDADRMAAALPWFPVVGALLGGCVYGVGMGLTRLGGGDWPAGLAVAMVLTGVLLTGALHLDGLADSADGFGAGGDRDRALAIMKDTHVGAFGVVALVLALLLRAAAYTQLGSAGRLEWVVGASVLARTAQVALAVWLPYARCTGTAADVVRQGRWWHLLVALGIAGALCAGLYGVTGRMAPAVAAAAVATLGWGASCRRRLGGVTGDTLGAGSELTELAVLVVAAWP